MSKKLIKIILISFVILSFYITFSFATDININLPGTDTNQTNENSENNTEVNNEQVENTINNENIENTDNPVTNEQENIDNSVNGNNTITDGTFQNTPTDVETLQPSVVTSDESGLSVTNIINILLITVGVIIILLDIFLFPIIRYNRYKYLITDDKIEVKKGLFLITRTIIQIKRVQKIEISDGPIDRKFSLASVNIYTAAGVADIKFLNKNEAEKITEEINNILKKNLEKNYEN